jgi:hypothetical protein
MCFTSSSSPQNVILDMNDNVESFYNGRQWDGSTRASGIPTGWGHVSTDDETVWSHFVDGIPHFLPDTPNPSNEPCAYLGDGIRYEGTIDMGRPIEGVITSNEGYHFDGRFYADGKPKEGCMFYTTHDGEPNGFWVGHFNQNGERSGSGTMVYRDKSKVHGHWTRDEIDDGDCTIIIQTSQSKECFHEHLRHGFVLAWFTSRQWNVLSKSCVSELFQKTLTLQRQVYQQDLTLSNRRFLFAWLHQKSMLYASSLNSQRLLEKCNGGSRTNRHDTKTCKRCLQGKSGTCKHVKYV